jgi:protein-disulfide isomerase
VRRIPSRIVLVGAVVVLTLAGRVGAENPDEPPARTHSDKVQESRDPNLPPAYGPTPSKVHVIVYSDFQCPVCARCTGATHQIAEEWPGDVRVEFRQLALAMHRHAEDAAVASLAAHRQGKFWAMHDVLFAHQSSLDPDSLTAHAREAGLDMDQYAKDYADPKLRTRVRAEKTLADRLGAKGTPTFIINGNVSSGWGSWQGFRHEVEMELKAADALIAKGTKLADVHAKRARTQLKDAAVFAAYKAAVIDPLAKSARSAPAAAPKSKSAAR